MSLRKFNIAVVEAFAPLIRKRLQGKEITDKEAKDRLERELEMRGFKVEDVDE